jgi:hypothetical protein
LAPTISCATASSKARWRRTPRAFPLTGWRLVAAEKTNIFAAPDATTRKHFVQFLSPKTAAVPRPAALDTALNEADAAEEQEEEKEYEDPFAEDGPDDNASSRGDPYG